MGIMPISSLAHRTATEPTNIAKRSFGKSMNWTAFQQLKNTAKTGGHCVTKMSPQALILPKFELHIGHFLDRERTFQELNRP